MKVSVIIPTYNRLKSLICALESIKTQDYDNFEIIVINDNSSEQDYYTYDWQGINIIHLDISPFKSQFLILMYFLDNFISSFFG